MVNFYPVQDAHASDLVFASGDSVLTEGNPPSGDWPTFQRDMGNTGAAVDAGPEDGEVMWTASLRFNSSDHSGMALADNSLYVGRSDSIIKAVDASDGAELWSVDTGDIAIWPSVTIDDDVLYAGGLGDDGNGVVYALDVSDGAELWSSQTQEYATTPRVVDGVVYTGTNGSDVGALHAFDASDGTKLWSHDSGEVRAPIAVGGGNVYCTASDGSSSGYVRGVDASDGTELWEYEIGAPAAAHSAATYADGTVYFHGGPNTTGYLYAVDPADGAEVWKYETGTDTRTSPAVGPDAVYTTGPGDDASYNDHLYAVDPSDGTLMWTFQAEDNMNYCSPSVAGGIVYAWDESGYVYAIDTSDGSEVWKLYTSDNYIRGSMPIADGTIYVHNHDNNLYAVE